MKILYMSRLEVKTLHKNALIVCGEEQYFKTHTE